MDDESIPIPPVGSPWPTVATFALTYNAYARHRGYQRVSTMGKQAYQRWQLDGTLPARVKDLRLTLFFEQRCWNHEGVEPEGPERTFIDEVLARLRELSPDGVPGPADPPYDRGPQVHRHTPFRRWLIHKRLSVKARRNR